MELYKSLKAFLVLALLCYLLKSFTGQFTVTVTCNNSLVAEGKTAKLAINTTGEGTLTYRWRRRGAGWFPDKALCRDTKALIIPEVDRSDEGEYYCIVSNISNITVESDNIELTTYGMLIVYIYQQVFIV